MVAFEVFNATLWNIVMSINKAENEACSLQIIRAPENFTGGYYYFGRKSELMDASLEMMMTHSIPLVNVDYMFHAWDIYQPLLMYNYKGGIPIMIV